MSNAVKISIIIPVFNTEKHIEKCLESICNQTLKEIEIICIDDFSTDNSLSIIQSYQKNDNRISIIRNSGNLGQGFSRNIGIVAAKGEYVNFIDSDDYIDLDYFEKLYSIAKSKNADIANAIIYYVLKDGTMSIGNWIYPYAYNKSEYTSCSEKLNLLYKNCNTSSCIHIYRKKMLENYQTIRFSERLYHEDQFFNFLAFYHANKIVIDISSPPKYYYQIYTGSSAQPNISDEIYKKKFFDLILITEIILQQANKMKLSFIVYNHLCNDLIAINTEKMSCIEQEYLVEYEKELNTVYKENFSTFFRNRQKVVNIIRKILYWVIQLKNIR